MCFSTTKGVVSTALHVLADRGTPDARDQLRATLAAAGLQLEVVQTEANLEDVFVELTA